MNYSAAKWFWVVVLGMVLGMAFDYLHVWGRVLYYVSPNWGDTSLWVFPEFGIVAAGAVLGLNRLAQRYPFPPVSAARTAFDAILLVFVHLAAGYLAGEGRGDNATAFWVLGAAAAASVLSRPLALVLIASALVAIAAPLSEMLISHLGFFHYYRGEPLVPRWLPFTWIVGVGLMIDMTVWFNRGLPGSTSPARR